MKKTHRLRKLLKNQRIIVAPGAHNAFTAKIIEQTGGFQAVYLTGSGTTMSLLGEPDVGLLTMTEMVTQAHNMANAVNLPLIADADTGYGNAINVARTVREYEQAGVAAIHIEDQVAPKNAGILRGSRLYPGTKWSVKYGRHWTHAKTPISSSLLAPIQEQFLGLRRR